MNYVLTSLFHSIGIFKKNIPLHYILIFPLFFLLATKSNAQEMEDDESDGDNINMAQFCLSKGCYSVFSSLNRDVSPGSLQNIQFVGPNNVGGRTKAVMVDVTNSGHLLAGGVLGGMWASHDTGKTWSPVNDTAISLSVTCIAQDNFNPNVIYYGGGQVYRDSPPTGVGIFKSTDGGTSFQLLPSSTNVSGFLFCNAMKASASDPNTLYIATFAGGLYKTRDGGQTFKQVFPNVDVTDVASFPSGEVLIGVYGLGIYKSPTGDSGTFVSIQNGMPPDSVIGSVKIDYCKKTPKTVYAVFGNTLKGSTSGLVGVYRSTNSGKSWRKMSNPDDNYNFMYPNLTMTVACKPSDPSYVVCGGAQLVFSKDSGKTWTACSLSHVDEQTIVFDPNNNSNFYVGNDGGIFRYNVTTLTTKTKQLNPGYNVSQFAAGAYFPTGLSALAGSWDNYPEIFLNGNTTFKKITNLPSGSDDNAFFCQINQQKSDTSYVEGPGGIIFRSNNTRAPNPTYHLTTNNLDSNNDGIIDEGALQDNPYEINLLSGDQLYYLTEQRVWRTTNGGQTWKPIMNRLGNLGAPSALGVSREVNCTIYLGGAKGVFFRIGNASTATPGHEVNLSASVPSYLRVDSISCITVDPTSNGNLLVAYNDNSTQPRLMRVTQAGTASPVWTSVSGDLPRGLPVNWVEIDPLNPTNFFIAATDYGLYTTVNGGAHWSKEALPNVKILNIRLRQSDRKLFIFTAGRGVWTADLPVSLLKSLSELYNSNLNKDLRCFIYPNPASNSLNVQIEGITVDHFRIAVIDNLGKRLMQQEFQGTSGMLNISSLAKGVYYLQVQTDEKNVCMQKIVKL